MGPEPRAAIELMEIAISTEASLQAAAMVIDGNEMNRILKPNGDGKVISI